MTTDPTLLADLAAASGPDRELDARVALCAGWKKPGHHGGYSEIVGVRPGGRGFAAVPRYTASIDAALTLVPEGWGWKADCGLGFGHSFTVGHVGVNKLFDRPEGWGKAATPAIALCIAALKARESTNA